MYLVFYISGIFMHEDENFETNFETTHFDEDMKERERDHTLKQQVIFKLGLLHVYTISPHSVKWFYLFNKVITACSPRCLCLESRPLR